MQIILPTIVVLSPLLMDLEEGAEFMYQDALLIKHDANGCGHYRCYNLSKKRWVSIGKSVAVLPVSVTCAVEYL